MLWTFVDSASYTVLNEILARQLHGGGIAEVFVALRLDVHAQLGNFFLRVVLEKVFIVNATADVADDVIVEIRVVILPEGVLADLEQAQSRGNLRVVRGFRRDQIGSGLHQRFMQLAGGHSVENAGSGAHSDSRRANVANVFDSPHHNAVVFFL
ncbi:Uncharacterised protein [Salmonella enterica subsp. enterica serovar Typhi]|nr:Uncharacterised protein [Salmonella enterica subsp. enterica serovar Typhi]